MAAAAEQLLPRLLLGVGERPAAPLDRHLDAHGPLPDLRRRPSGQLIDLVEAAGLRGHGGASFPAATKMRAVAARRGPAFVVANGSEGEPASNKDRFLLRELPHLVLDGAAVASRAVGAREAIIALSGTDDRSVRSLQLALRERREARVGGDPRFELFGIEPSYVAGQESALVGALNGDGSARPTLAPPRPFEQGIRRRPTLVQNVETLAHLALIARHGADWFRQVGTPCDPGSALVTVSGAVAAPGVYEIAHGTRLAELLGTAVLDDRLAAVLIGGYFGSWIPASDVSNVRLDSERLADYGATLGAGVIVALGANACPVAETSRIADFFAAESAGQCGPCVNGLDAIACTVQQLAAGTAARTARRDLERWTSELPRRGACQHPDGAVRFITSSLRVFEAEFRDHARRGACERCRRSAVLPAPISARRRG
jgi:NADH:ubiquinone oxidoreductase subunit F (NADH-binding)